jgi:hypothetical protein
LRHDENGDAGSEQREQVMAFLYVLIGLYVAAALWLGWEIYHAPTVEDDEESRAILARLDGLERKEKAA